MTVEIVSYTWTKEGMVIIEAENCDGLQLQRIERLQDDYIQRNCEFVFDLHDQYEFSYLRRFLKKQKRVQEANPATWGEALQLVVGCVTTISGRYLNRVV